MKKIYMYVLDTMADWENGYLLQGLTLQNMLGTRYFEIQTVAKSKQPIVTASGIKIIPDITLNEIDEDNAAALLLIGADTWLEIENEAVLKIAEKFYNEKKIVAAICGATLGLAKFDMLNNCNHTSNALFYLQNIPNYKGGKLYIDEPAVKENRLITAGSAGSLLWAKYILEELAIYSRETIDAWYNYFLTGQAAYFSQLLHSFDKQADSDF